jgi:AcrR family transcriptional regulator
MAGVMAKSGYHHGDLRQQLIAATRALVEEKGPDGFSVSEACRAAGVSTAAPYKHFSDRTDMLRAVRLEGYREMTDAFRRAVESLAPGSIEAIAEVGVAYVAYAEANPGLFRMMFGASDGSEEMEAAGQDCYAVVLNQIAARLGREEIDDEVMRTGFPLWTFVHGLSFLRIDEKAGFEKVQRTVEELVSEATRRLLEV